MCYCTFAVVAVALVAFAGAQAPLTGPGPAVPPGGPAAGGHEGVVQIQACQDIKQAEVTCVGAALKAGTPSIDLGAIKQCFATCVRTPSPNAPAADPKRAAFETCVSGKAMTCIQQGATGVQFVQSGVRVDHNWAQYGWGGKGAGASASPDIVARLLNASSKCGAATQTCVTAALPPNAASNTAALSAQFKTSLCAAYQTDATKRATCTTQRGLVKAASCTCRSQATRQANVQACTATTGYTPPANPSASTSASTKAGIVGANGGGIRCSPNARPERPRQPKFCPAPATAAGASANAGK